MEGCKGTGPRSPANVFGVYTINADGTGIQQLTRMRLKRGNQYEEDGVHGPIRWRQ